MVDFHILSKYSLLNLIQICNLNNYFSWKGLKKLCKFSPPPPKLYPSLSEQKPLTSIFFLLLDSLPTDSLNPAMSQSTREFRDSRKQGSAPWDSARWWGRVWGVDEYKSKRQWLAPATCSKPYFGNVFLSPTLSLLELNVGTEQQNLPLSLLNF